MPATASLLRELIYGGVVATGSLWAASLLVDVVAHLAAHGSAPLPDRPPQFCVAPG